MKRIFKYEIQVTDYPIIELPLNAEILDFQSQLVECTSKEELYIWAIINDEEGLNNEKRYFRLAGTGHSLDKDFPNRKIKKYIGTTQMRSEGLVFHLFEMHK